MQTKINVHCSKIFSLLNQRDKKKVYYLLFFSILISSIEFIGISAIMPFIAIAQNYKSSYTQWITSTFSLEHFELVILFGSVLILFYIMRGMVNIYYYYILHKFSYDKCHDIAVRLFSKYMHSSYQNFTYSNSSVWMKNINIEAKFVTRFMIQLIFMFSEILTISFIYVVLLYIQWKVIIGFTFILLLQVYILTSVISKYTKKMGQKRTRVQQAYNKYLKQSFDNFKILKISNSEQKIIEEIRSLDRELTTAYTVNSSLQVIPRNFLELIGFPILIVAVIYAKYMYEDISSILPLISVFALALYRILPALNRLLSGYNEILFSYPAVDTIFRELKDETQLVPQENIIFDKEIELKNVSFYHQDKKILGKVNLKIPKKAKVALVGESGSGKTTLVDLITGLYTPTNGSILIDGVKLSNKYKKSWCEKIGYIPQNIYLFEGSVAQNIALYAPINEEQIIKVLKQAKVYDFFCSRNGVHTQVGEGGVQLSGGQMQRVGIARALYRNPEILIFDEATSALDIETEKKIIKEIYQIGKEKTVFIIAHRLNTISNCDIKYNVASNRVGL